MRSSSVLPALALGAALFLPVACQRYSDRLDDDGEDGGSGDDAFPSPCAGATLFVQGDSANDSTDSATVVDSGGGDLVFFGATNDGASFASLQGYFRVGGYVAGQAVTAQVVTATCATDTCPTTIGFRFFEAQNLANVDGACGTATVTADGDGAIAWRATGGGTGGGGGGGGTGANGPDTGLRLTPQ